MNHDKYYFNHYQKQYISHGSSYPSTFRLAFLEWMAIPSERCTILIMIEE